MIDARPTKPWSVGLRVATASFLLLTLAGCAESVSRAPDASDPGMSPSPSAPTAIEEDDMAACAILSETLQTSTGIVTAIVEDPTGATLDPAVVAEEASKLREMLELSTAKMDAYAAPYASTVLLLDDIFKGKVSGSQTVDTGAFRDSVLPLMTYCTDEVGYTSPEN